MRFVLRCELPVHLVLSSALLGKDHCFQFEGREICIAISDRCYLPFEDGSDRNDEKVATCVSWKDGGECLKASIHLVFLTVEILSDDEINVTDDMVTSDESTNQLFWEKNTFGSFNAAGKKISEIASAAFDYWCRVVRWKTGASHVGLPIRQHDAHPGWRYLAAVNPLHHVATFNDTMNVYSYNGISIDEWAEIEAALVEHEQPPIWNETFHEAMRRFATGDFRGALLDAAISVEAFLRRHLLSVLDPLPDDEKALRKRVENWNMTDVLNNLTKVSTLRSLGLSPDQTRLLKTMFEIRNSIMHGKHVELDKAALVEVMNAVKSIIRA